MGSVNLSHCHRHHLHHHNVHNPGRHNNCNATQQPSHLGHSPASAAPAPSAHSAPTAPASCELQNVSSSQQTRKPLPLNTQKQQRQPRPADIDTGTYLNDTYTNKKTHLYITRLHSSDPRRSIGFGDTGHSAHSTDSTDSTNSTNFTTPGAPPQPPQPTPPTPPILPPTGSPTSVTSAAIGDNNNNNTVANTISDTIPNTTATTTSTTLPTTASSNPSASGSGPRTRDQNVTPTTRVLLRKRGTMPYDNNNRPQMPSLSAAAARVVNRTPITPKIAAKAQQQPHPPPTIATTTPANKRAAPRPLTASSTRDAPNNRRLSGQHDESAAFAPHISSNITPRSGSRQTRVDSANSTPNTTPNPERTADLWDPRSSYGMPTSPRLGEEATRRPIVTFSPLPSDHNGSSESKFFHASDAKPARSPSAASKPAAAKSPTFFYANGNMVDNNNSSSNNSKSPISPAFAPAQDNSQDALSSKFMYANGAPDVRPSPPVSRSSGSTMSTTSKAPTSRPTTNPPTGNHTPDQRPASPSKPPPQRPQPLPKHHNLPPGSGRPQALSPPQLGPSPPGLRRSSSGTSRTGGHSRGHSRSGSLAKGEHATGPSKLSGPPVSLEPTSPLSISSPKPAPLTLASIIQAAEEFAETEEPESPDEPRSGLQSPTKSVNSTEPVSELVANARRERKVQDLEIRNASLEAINRTLERQLRKQSAELRRYRRLSRAGRFVVVPAPISSRASDTLSELQEEESSSIPDLGEEESGWEDEPEEEDSLSDTDSTTESLSPSVEAEQDAKHRTRDERRLQLDLTKHQELLIDSQKINQSIKRCLDWTEELIKDGKKALEYHVRVSDVELGGRVLDPLDEEDYAPLSADISPDDTITLAAKMLDDPISLPSWGIQPQDRDSGIELPRDGS
ncbi:hypothetical protein F5B20DRAFT_583011 [Whalleya microplaca]|nr:hypothetical protein F5B20DRAFT_583011 [Whalleya microplaca]